jgi:hypothetical protein
VQRKIYGYKWECPNGDDCHYKHCLPKGFIIQTAKDRMQEEMSIEDYMNLEESIDIERDRIGKIGTSVNDQTFAEWKKNRDAFRAKGKEEVQKNKKVQTGIELFKNSSNLFKDDENAADDIVNEENQLEDTNTNTENTSNNIVVKTEGKFSFLILFIDEIMKELENDMKGIKVNAELFTGEEDLDELNDIDDGEGEGIQEEEKTSA